MIAQEVSTKILWARDTSEVQAAAKFFVDHVQTSYISHGEVQSGRALDFTTWHPDLGDILTKEFGRCLTERKHSADLLGLLMEGDEIVSMAYVTAFRSKHASFAVLEDIITHKGRRSHGYGAALYAWIEKELVSMGIHEVFLESGRENGHAHKFLEAIGFSMCSIVMSKKLS